jgi:predicted esterase
MRMTTTEKGGLTTRVVEACDKPSLAVILCHGFGAGGDDLVPLRSSDSI